MSLEKIHLSKLLKIFYSDTRKQISLLREDIRNEIKKENSADGSGGDFYIPFWADAKAHASGQLDLREKAKLRIDSNKGRERLYSAMTIAFLKWWEEKRRWRNEPFTILPASPKKRYQVKELNTTVKIENLVSARIGEQTHRLIYPYLTEEPALGEEGARIGLWLLGEALTAFKREDIRILDVLRSASFGLDDVPLQGNEQAIFLQRYSQVLAKWKELWKEYED